MAEKFSYIAPMVTPASTETISAWRYGRFLLSRAATYPPARGHITYDPINNMESHVAL